MAVLLDDHLLGRALTDSLTERDLDAIDEDEIGTTGCWYYRLCQAVRSDRVRGLLSAPFANLASDELRGRSVDLLTTLPEEIRVAPLRDLAPTMAELVQRHPLNLIALEALASAGRWPAAIVLDRRNAHGPLPGACEAEGVEVRIV